MRMVNLPSLGQRRCIIFNWEQLDVISRARCAMEPLKMIACYVLSSQTNYTQENALDNVLRKLLLFHPIWFYGKAFSTLKKHALPNVLMALTQINSPMIAYLAILTAKLATNLPQRVAFLAIQSSISTMVSVSLPALLLITLTISQTMSAIRRLSHKTCMSRYYHLAMSTKFPRTNHFTSKQKSTILEEVISLIFSGNSQNLTKQIPQMSIYLIKTLIILMIKHSKL